MPFMLLPEDPFALVGDLVSEDVEVNVGKSCPKPGVDKENDCWSLRTEELVFAMVPLFIKLEGRSPNLGNANVFSVVAYAPRCCDAACGGDAPTLAPVNDMRFRYSFNSVLSFST